MVQASVMASEVQNCERSDYSPEGLPLLLHQVLVYWTKTLQLGPAPGMLEV